MKNLDNVNHAVTTRRALLRHAAYGVVAADTLLAAWACAQSTAPADDPFARILPRPRHIERGTSDFVISGKTTITISGPEMSRCQSIARILADRIEEEFGLRLNLVVEHPADDWHLRIGEPAVSPRRSEGTESERYQLNVDARGATGTSRTAQGLLWAAMTFRQLLSKRGDTVTAAGCRIDDWPRYQWRGFMIDSGRSPNTLAQMKRIVRVCSALKLNYVVFREGDDELSAVRYRTNKLGRENPCALTMEQVADFVAYCDQYGMAVVPEIESLGHSTAKGLAYPELVSGGFEQKYPGIGVHVRKASIKPDDPRSLELLRSIYDEWFPLLRSPLVHLGLDEVRLPKETQAQHLARLLPVVESVAKKHHKTVTPLVWADAPPTPEAFRDSVIRVLWDYGDGQGVSLSNPHLMKQGIVELSEKGATQKVFMAGGSGSGHTTYSKTGYEAAFNNLAVWTRHGDSRPNFIGVLSVQWSGNMLDEWLPDFACAADFAWSPPAEIPVFATQLRRVESTLARIRDAARPRKDEVDPPAWDGIWLKDRKWDRNVLAAPATQVR